MRLRQWFTSHNTDTKEKFKAAVVRINYFSKLYSVQLVHITLFYRVKSHLLTRFIFTGCSFSVPKNCLCLTSNDKKYFICVFFPFSILQEEDLYEINVPLKYTSPVGTRIHGLACWFDVLFDGRFST